MQRRSWIQAATRTAGAMVLAALATLAGCAAPPPAADTTLLQRMDGVMRQASAQRPVQLQLDPAQITTGAKLRALVNAPTGGFVYLFQLNTDGKSLAMVFPNAFDNANHLPAGQAMLLPRPNWVMSAQGPAGVGYLMAVVSDAPQDLNALQAGLAAGELPVRPPYGAALASLREVAP